MNVSITYQALCSFNYFPPPQLPRKHPAPGSAKKMRARDVAMCVGAREIKGGHGCVCVSVIFTL